MENENMYFYKKIAMAVLSFMALPVLNLLAYELGAEHNIFVNFLYFVSSITAMFLALAYLLQAVKANETENDVKVEKVPIVNKPKDI